MSTILIVIIISYIICELGYALIAKLHLPLRSNRITTANDCN